MLTVRGTPEEVAGDVMADWERLQQIPLGAAGQAHRQRSTTATSRKHDALDEISPVDYVEALTGIEVPSHGTICCPLPDHEDGAPSCKVYDQPERGWYCFGCGRGGTIYDLGAQLWNISTRGAAFHDLRRELARQLLRSELP